MPKAIPNIVSVSPFNNLAAAALADELGTVKAQIADLETREKALRDELIRRGVSTIEGETYSATITEAVRWTLDSKTVRAEMGQALVGCPLPAIPDHHRCREGARRPGKARGVGGAQHEPDLPR